MPERLAGKYRPAAIGADPAFASAGRCCESKARQVSRRTRIGLRFGQWEDLF